MKLFIRNKNMIKNEFQKVYRQIISQQIISQAPIFDTFDDQVIKPKLVKVNDDYYFDKMRDFENIDLDEVVNGIYEKDSNLLYFYINPFPIYDSNASKDFDLFKVKSYEMDKYDTINSYDYNNFETNSKIALQFSIISLADINPFESNQYNPKSFIVERLARYLEEEEGIANQINETLTHYDERLQQTYSDYDYDIFNKGGILFVYSIVDLETDKILYIDYDIFENKKFLSEMIPHTNDYLKAKVKKYFQGKKVFDKIKTVLTNKLIEIKNNY